VVVAPAPRVGLGACPESLVYPRPPRRPRTVGLLFRETSCAWSREAAELGLGLFAERANAEVDILAEFILDAFSYWMTVHLMHRLIKHAMPVPDFPHTVADRALFDMLADRTNIQGLTLQAHYDNPLVAIGAPAGALAGAAADKMGPQLIVPEPAEVPQPVGTIPGATPTMGEAHHPPGPEQCVASRPRDRPLVGKSATPPSRTAVALSPGAPWYETSARFPPRLRTPAKADPQAPIEFPRATNPAPERRVEKSAPGRLPGIGPATKGRGRLTARPPGKCPARLPGKLRESPSAVNVPGTSTDPLPGNRLANTSGPRLGKLPGNTSVPLPAKPPGKRHERPLGMSAPLLPRHPIAPAPPRDRRPIGPPRNGPTDGS